MKFHGEPNNTTCRCCSSGLWCRDHQRFRGSCCLHLQWDFVTTYKTARCHNPVDHCWHTVPTVRTRNHKPNTWHWEYPRCDGTARRLPSLLCRLVCLWCCPGGSWCRCPSPADNNKCLWSLACLSTSSQQLFMLTDLVSFFLISSVDINMLTARFQLLCLIRVWTAEWPHKGK